MEAQPSALSQSGNPENKPNASSSANSPKNAKPMTHFRKG